MLQPVSDEQKQRQREMEEFYSYTSERPPEWMRFGGSFWNFSADDYVNSAVEMYTNEDTWLKSVTEGHAICRRRMGFTRNNIIYLK